MTDPTGAKLLAASVRATCHLNRLRCPVRSPQAGNSIIQWGHSPTSDVPGPEGSAAAPGSILRAHGTSASRSTAEQAATAATTAKNRYGGMALQSVPSAPVAILATADCSFPRAARRAHQERTTGVKRKIPRRFSDVSCRTWAHRLDRHEARVAARGFQLRLPGSSLPSGSGT